MVIMGTDGLHWTADRTGVDNPFALAFSPWTRDSPGFTAGDPIRWIDFVGSVAFGAVDGGALGISFWHFYSRAERANPAIGGSGER